MNRILRLLTAIALLALVAGCSMNSSGPTSEEETNRVAEARVALNKLFSHTPGARELSTNAAGILVFPDITKAGFLVGGQYGTGVLFKNGKAVGFYRSTAASYGLQAGVQQFGYALFFMSPSDLSYLTKSEGWEVGVGPTLTVVDKGFANSITTTTARSGVYAFFFEQKGLMAGLGIQGTKITETGKVS